VGSIGVLRQAVPESDFAWQAVGICERLASVALLAALGPMVVASGVALSLFSGRSPLIAHRRVGWRGSTLWMLKLRTMWGHEDACAGRRPGWIEYIDDDRGPRLKQAADPRVNSRFARFCRRHSIDELPQLWHVIRGEMSLVGPRPMTAGELRHHYEEAAAEVLDVKPGIAGLWQVSGRNQLSYPERRQLDLELVRRRSVRMYLEILVRALPEVWSGTNSW
jgi:exopolysaccharide production protein ExoY